MSKTCPFCAETIGEEAVVCPQCRTPLDHAVGSEAYRNRPGRQIAGVAEALAHALSLSVTFVRLLFIVFTFASFVGPLVYGAMWLLIPYEPGGLASLGRIVRALGGDEREGDPSLLERSIHWSRRQLDRFQQWLRTRRHKQSTEGTP